MKLRNIKLTIEYDGTEFNGWQIQGKKERTIQGEIKKALSKITGQSVTIFGSGRTDSGVHALGQVTHFKTESRLPAQEMLRALNANLPDDIAILKVEDVPANFHAQFKAKSKVYRYTILNRSARGAQLRNFCLFYPYPLNIRLMREEAKVLVGRKDFRSFCASDPKRYPKEKKESTVRTVKRITIQKKADFVLIDIEADGFLYKMVRNIVGTLLAVGSGQLKAGITEKILKAKDRTQAPKTAPAKGLCLLKVKY